MGRMKDFFWQKGYIWKVYRLRNRVLGRTPMWAWYTDEDFDLIASQVARRMQLTECSSTLEIGCGEGAMSIALIRQLYGLKVAGFDREKALITAARRAIPDGEFWVEDLQGLQSQNRVGSRLKSLPDDSYDLVFCFGVLTFLEPALCPLVVEEMLRVTKVGGHVWLGANLEERDREYNWGVHLLPNDVWDYHFGHNYLVDYENEWKIFGVKKYSPHSTSVFIQKRAIQGAC